MHKTDCHCKGNEHAGGKVFAFTLLLLKPRISHKDEIQETVSLLVHEAVETDVKNVIPASMPRGVGHILPFHSLPAISLKCSMQRKKHQGVKWLEIFLYLYHLVNKVAEKCHCVIFTCVWETESQLSGNDCTAPCWKKEVKHFTSRLL